jgi:hypothetical protein
MKSKFFRIAVEGGTTDGRVIEREWLEQMAADYVPATYSARINLEHIRGFSPEPPFNAYGDVLALETREVELEIAGKTEKRLALYAQVDATDALVELNRQRQKLFSSCEIAPNFGGKGRAYLVGLAFTDTPASLGTEMLTFAAGQGENNPLAGRKQDAANLFTAAEPLELEAEEAADEPVTIKGLVELVGSLVARFKGTTEPTPPAPPAPPAPPEPPEPANDNLSQLAQSIEQLAAAMGDKVETLSAQVAEMSQQLDTTPAPGAARPIAAGGNQRLRSDC